MLSSVRARLTMWHTFVLALLLGLFAISAYYFVLRLSRARTDSAVLDSVAHLEVELIAERPSHASTREAAVEVLRKLHFRQIAFVVFDSSGNLVAASRARRKSGPEEGSAASLDVSELGRIASAAATAEAQVVPVPDREGGFRAAVTSMTMPDGRFVVSAALPVYVEAEELSDAREAMLVAIPVTLLLASLFGWFLAKHSLEPMVTMRERAAGIGATNLGDRVPIKNPADEVGQLASVINDLLGRLEHAFERQRQFMADASHELRTPVAVVQHEASLALSRPHRNPEEYEDSLSIVRDAGRRMRLIVDDLFLLASADAGEVPMRREPLYLDEVVSDCVRVVRALAQSRDIAVLLELPEEAPFTGDEALLNRLVLNLIDNAIKYSPAGSVVTLRLAVAGDRYRLEVADTGPGIAAEVQAHIFERFVRADVARTHDDTHTSGAGLGLSIARWIAGAHCGELYLERSSPEGSVFVLSLPIAGC
ncbi:MAG: two-component histidine kinase [Gemmatimonadetes bacterium]|nr:two-component histidine kinase [Gemmatimonadota bacterium]